MNRQARHGEGSGERDAPLLGGQPGDIVRAYAGRKGYPLAGRNIIVEGTTDVDHLTTAASVYEAEEHLALLGEDLSVFAVGERQDGGTRNLVQEFQTLRNILRVEPYAPEDDAIRIIALLDKDNAGQRAIYTLTSREVGFVEFRDVFPVARIMPRDTRDARQLAKRFRERNAPWSMIDCEIEDLVADNVLASFAESNPEALRGEPRRVEGAHHYEWEGHAKPALARYVNENALLDDISAIVDLLKSLRYALDLVPDGQPRPA